MTFLEYYQEEGHDERKVILILKRGHGRIIVSRDGAYRNTAITLKELDSLLQVTKNNGVKLRESEHPSYYTTPHKFYYDPDYIHHAIEFYNKDIIDRAVPSLILISMAIFPTANNRVLCDFPVETRKWSYDEYRKFMQVIRLDAICVTKKKLETDVYTESVNAFRETLTHLKRIDFRGRKRNYLEKEK